MRPERKAARRREIEEAAYAVLAEKGYGATSMLAVARRAGASNETLYKWYGNKQALFRSIVEGNAGEVAELLRDGVSAGRDPWDTLESIGPVLLRLLTGEKAIALNRAAVMDSQETGILGRTLAEAGRDTVAPLIARVFEEGRAGGQMVFANTEDAVEVYIGLLVGDLQIRRAIGVLGPLDEAELHRRSDRAIRLLRKIFGSRNAVST